MKLDKFFDEKTVIDLSFFNFSNAVTAAYFANQNLEVLRVNKNFKKFFPILKTVNNIPFTSIFCLLYTSPSPRDGLLSRMPSSA